MNEGNDLKAKPSPADFKSFLLVYITQGKATGFWIGVQIDAEISWHYWWR